MSLCKYRDIFGKVGQGGHSLRFFNIAVVDTVLTFVAAYIINYYLKTDSLLLIFFILIILSILIHKAFCVETTLTKMFFSFK
jgi:hypothetical protein